MKHGKVWGATELLFANPMLEIRRIKIAPGSRCSLHRHDRKANAFYVLKGRLFIEVVKNDYPLIDVTELGPGEFTSVSPGEHHKFRTAGRVGCEALEIYYLEPLSDDIARKDHGGKVR